MTFPSAHGREGPVIECSAPVRVGGAEGERWGTVRVGLSLKPVQREMMVARVSLLLAVFCGVLAAVFASHTLARRITRPLAHLVDAATEMERGRWNREFSIRTGDEIEELAGRFARAAGSLDRQKKELLAAKEELTALNATLEEKVQRRTAELADSREKYRLLVEGSPDAFVLLEQDRIAFANRAFLKIFQYPADSGVLENLLWTQVIHSDFHRAARDHIRRAEESLGDFHAELIGQTRAGRPVELEVRGRGVKFRGGIAVELVLADVGEKKRLLRQVVQHERLRAMGEMTTMVAHNFNNLLAVVLGRSQLLLRKTDDPEVREGLETDQDARGARGGHGAASPGVLRRAGRSALHRGRPQCQRPRGHGLPGVALEDDGRAGAAAGDGAPRSRPAAAGLRRGTPPAGRLPADHHQCRRGDAGGRRDPRADPERRRLWFR